MDCLVLIIWSDDKHKRCRGTEGGEAQPYAPTVLRFSAIRTRQLQLLLQYEYSTVPWAQSYIRKYPSSSGTTYIRSASSALFAVGLDFLQRRFRHILNPALNRFAFSLVFRPAAFVRRTRSAVPCARGCGGLLSWSGPRRPITPPLKWSSR